MTVILKNGVPFAGTPNLSPAVIAKLYDKGTWTAADLSNHGLDAAVSFVVPDGKVTVGDPRYVQTDGIWYEQYDVADDVPEPREQRIRDFQLDPQTVSLVNLAKNANSPAQIDNWLTTNVTTLAQARTVLGALIKVIITKELL